MNDWQTVVRDLEGSGRSLTEIARETGASIGAISDLKHGRTREPRASVAIALLALRDKREPSAQQLDS